MANVHLLHITGRMKGLLLGFVFCTISVFSFFQAGAQYNISGKVTASNGAPVVGASVYLFNTIDGATTDSSGIFSFETEETGAQTIVAEQMDYQKAGLPITIDKDITELNLIMKTVLCV